MDLINLLAEQGQRIMTPKPTPKAIPLERADGAFHEGKARNITIVRLSEKEWIFTFEATNPATGSGQLYTLKTQRGKVRTWSDPRNLFQWLCERYGVKKGLFSLVPEDVFDEE